MVKALLAFGAIVLALPVLVLVGIAMGPAALVFLFICGFAAVVLLAAGAIQRGKG